MGVRCGTGGQGNARLSRLRKQIQGRPGNARQEQKLYHSKEDP
jgi:hypothetical protein